MKRHLRSLFALGAVSLACLSAGSDARASFQIVVTEGSTVVPIVDGGSFDQDGIVAGELARSNVRIVLVADAHVASQCNGERED